jgi:hypothetical protein
MALTWPSKDPAETLDYDLDWTLRLAGDTITASSWAIAQTDSPAAGTLTMGTPPSTFTTTRAKVWLAGGNLGQSYTLVNTVHTTAGEIEVESVLIVIRSK